MAERSIKRHAILLGFALGGFFDGIMLHQVLQWHHLLSLVPGAGDLRAQILYDGLFHILMYVLAVIALAGLWRAGREGIDRRQLAVLLLLGFGIWQIVDVVLFHWILEIHRIRVDRPDPLAWDVGWLVVVGGLPLIAAWLLGRSGRGASVRNAPPLLLALTAGTAAAGAWALQGPPDQRFTTVVFAQGLSEAQMMGALAASGAAVAGSAPAQGIYVVALDEGRGWELYRRGALFVAGSGTPAGCSAWSVA